jgi:glycosyltransferase involved in cell wall biosynthesis
MKVLHAAETIKGGVATVLKQLALSQCKDEEITRLLCLIPDDQVEELASIDRQYIKTFHRTGRNLSSFFAFFSTFISTVLKAKPDIVHLHSSFAGFLARIALFILWPLQRPKVIYCPHAFSFLMQGSGNKKKVFSALEKLMIAMTDAVVCVSEYERERAIEYGFPADKLHVIYNGVPIVDSRDVPANPYAADVLNMLFVGRFDYQKGFDILATVMKGLKGLPFQLTAVGGHVHSKESRHQGLVQTTYTGWLKSEALVPYFYHADVLVIPSRWEGFAMVPLEAMSYGLPVIASHCTSFPEMVKDGQTGFLFELNNPDALLKILLETSTSQWKVMGEAGKQFFLTKFTAENMIINTSALYKKVSGNYR